jgi:hypothetical protein
MLAVAHHAAALPTFQIRAGADHAALGHLVGLPGHESRIAGIGPIGAAIGTGVLIDRVARAQLVAVASGLWDVGGPCGGTVAAPNAGAAAGQNQQTSDRDLSR